MDRDNRFPTPSQQPLAVDFLENRKLEYRSVDGDLSCTYSVDKQEFVERPLTRAAQNIRSMDAEEEVPRSDARLAERNAGFLAAVERLKKKDGKKGVASKFDLSGCHDWTEVMRVVKQVEEAYQNDDSKSGKVRKVFRNISEHSESLKAFVNVLPDGNYKTLCGGLTLILTAMKSRSDIVEKMGDVMGELPGIINDCEDYEAMYAETTVLRTCVDDIYCELMLALQYIVNWYTESFAKKAVKILARNANYCQPLDLQLKKIQACKQRFEAELQKCLHWRTRIIGVTGIETYRKVDELTRSVPELKTLLNGLKNVLGDHVNSSKWQNQIQLKLEEQERDHISDTQRIKYLESHLTSGTHTPESLGRVLDIRLPEDGFLIDTHQVQRAGLSHLLKFQERARWVAERPAFRDWLKSSRSRSLLVQDRSTLERISPLSFLVSLLYEKLEQTSKTLALPFFCGLHTVRESGMPLGPTLLARALLVQILSQTGIDWENGPHGLPVLSCLEAETVSDLHENTIAAYLTAVGHLLMVVRRQYDAVVILVDGIEYYEDKHSEEVAELIQSLMRLVRAFNKARKDEGTGTLKILFTVSTRTRCFPAGKKSVTKIDVPAALDGDGNGFGVLV